MSAQPAAPAPLADIYMPDDACVVQVSRIDEGGLVSQMWAVPRSFSDVCEQIEALFGSPMGGLTTNTDATERLYSTIHDEQDAGHARAVPYE